MLNELRERADRLEAAHRLVKESIACYQQAHGEYLTFVTFNDLLLELDKEKNAASKELKKRENEILGSSRVLQVTFTGNGVSARIAVRRPSRTCDDPHLTYEQWLGVLAYLGIVEKSKERFAVDVKSDTDFEIAVLDNLYVARAAVSRKGTRVL